MALDDGPEMQEGAVASKSQAEIAEALGLTRVDLERLRNIRPVRDYSVSFWELPFTVNQVGFVLHSGKDAKKSGTGWSSSTEGRSFGLDRFVFRFRGGKLETANQWLLYPIPRELRSRNMALRPVSFSDYQEKGGGMQPDLLPESVRRTQEDEFTARYFHRSVLGRKDPGPPAGAFYDHDIGLDEAFSFLFHAWGGRTRLPIATFPIDYLPTPEGRLSREQAVTREYISEDQQAVSSHWGVRCRWRLDDLVSIFSERDFRSTSSRSRFVAGFVHPGVEFFKFKAAPSPEDKQKALYFARELTTRMAYDDDSRWKELGQGFSEINEDNLSEFYLDYLTLLSRTLGEQLGILYKNRVYLYMLNYQNFTALGEIVDFDVAVFEARYFIDGTELSREEMERNNMLTEEEATRGVGPNEPELQARTFFATMAQLTSLFACFRHPGIINIPPDEFQSRYDKAMAEFGRGFAKEGLEFGYRPQAVVRNLEFFRNLDTVLAETEHWTSQANPISLGLEGINKLVYGTYIHALERKRIFDYD